jgi:hypothetical protein
VLIIFIFMLNLKDVTEANVGLVFLIWMLMSTMMGTVSYKFRARDVLTMYQEESVGQWSLPIFMGLLHCQYSRFDPLRIWHKDPRQETH